MKKYDIAVIGGGPGGYVAAIKAAQFGAKTALIEEHRLGGVCLNIGCIPTKTLIKSAKVYEQVLNSREFGVDIEDNTGIGINWNRMLERKDEVVHKLIDGVELLLMQNGIDVFHKHAEVIDKNTIDVDGEVISTNNLILATGSVAHIPDIKGIKESMEMGYVVTSTEALSFDKIPETLIVIGGGVVGIEFATMYSSLGSKVTVFQRSQILNNTDKDIRNEMERILREKGLNLIYGAELKAFHENSIVAEVDGEDKIFYADKILISMGRKPNFSGIEKLPVKKDKRGISTDNNMKTNIEGVYAIGDVNGKFMLAHVASAEGIIAVENIFGKDSSIDYNKIPSCIYTVPEVGIVGYSEEEAIEKGYKVISSKFPFSINGKALAEGETEGFVKIVADEEDGKILGFHIIASHATDMVSEGAATIELQGTIFDLAKTIHPHPTFSEVVAEAAYGAIGKPIHELKSIN